MLGQHRLRGLYHVKTRKVETDGEGVEGEDSDDTEHSTVLGIDLGVNSLAVPSTGTFWSGDEFDHWIQEFEKRRAELQQRGTQAAHNALSQLRSESEYGGNSTSTSIRSLTTSSPKPLNMAAM